MKKTASSKRYPFSMVKHAHDLELYRDHSFGLGDAGRHQEVTGLLWRVMDASDGRTALLDGQDYAWAMRIVAWADKYRAECLRSMSPK